VQPCARRESFPFLFESAGYQNVRRGAERDSRIKGASPGDRKTKGDWLEEDEEDCGSQQEADHKRRPTLN
jgi:hypothetical protein